MVILFPFTESCAFIASLSDLRKLKCFGLALSSANLISVSLLSGIYDLISTEEFSSRRQGVCSYNHQEHDLGYLRELDVLVYRIDDLFVISLGFLSETYYLVN